MNGVNGRSMNPVGVGIERTERILAEVRKEVNEVSNSGDRNFQPFKFDADIHDSLETDSILTERGVSRSEVPCASAPTVTTRSGFDVPSSSQSLSHSTSASISAGGGSTSTSFNFNACLQPRVSRQEGRWGGRFNFNSH